MLPPRDPSQIERYTQTKCKGMEKDLFHENGKEKKNLEKKYLYLTEQTLK